MKTLKIALLVLVLGGFPIGPATGDASAHMPITGFEKR